MNCALATLASKGKGFAAGPLRHAMWLIRLDLIATRHWERESTDASWIAYTISAPSFFTNTSHNLLSPIMSKRGAFVVIEGLDRSGKSTQAATLIKRLQDANVPSKLIKFPGQFLFVLLASLGFLDLFFFETAPRRLGK